MVSGLGFGFLSTFVIFLAVFRPKNILFRLSFFVSYLLSYLSYLYFVTRLKSFVFTLFSCSSFIWTILPKRSLVFSNASEEKNDTKGTFPLPEFNVNMDLAKGDIFQSFL